MPLARLIIRHLPEVTATNQRYRENRTLNARRVYINDIHACTARSLNVFGRRTFIDNKESSNVLFEYC